jgi:hypothetical protein
MASDEMSLLLQTLSAPEQREQRKADGHHRGGQG